MSAGPWVLGLTGGIGSGKSAVSERFAANGAAVVDTDLIAHALTAADGAAMAPIRAAFGDAVVAADGALDRAAMRARVFAAPAERQRLEAILHPMIRAESERLCLAATAPYVMLVVPLLIESGTYRQRVRRLCVVDCPEEVQVARVMQRSGLEERQVRATMAAQATRAERLAAADDVVDNGSSYEQLAAQVERLHVAYLQLAAKAGAV